MIVQLCNARQQQLKASRKWVAFTNPRTRKSPVLRNRDSRIRHSHQWLPNKAAFCKAPLFILSSHLWPLWWHRRQQYLHTPSWSPSYPSFLFSPLPFSPPPSSLPPPPLHSSLFPRYTKKKGSKIIYLFNILLLCSLEMQNT